MNLILEPIASWFKDALDVDIKTCKILTSLESVDTPWSVRLTQRLIHINLNTKPFDNDTFKIGECVGRYTVNRGNGVIKKYVKSRREQKAVKIGYVYQKNGLVVV